MANTVEHQGVVENVNGYHLQVRIIQASACAACSARRHCSSSDTKEKLVDVTDVRAASYRPGDQVRVFATLGMGAQAVLYAFVIPFIILVIAVFLYMSLSGGNELTAALLALATLVPYYLILWLCRGRMAKRFSFWIEKTNQNKNN